MELHASIHEDDDGSFWADVRELPGCFALGTTISELTDAILEAVGMCLEHEPIEGAAAGTRRVRARVEEMTLITV
jgi:predicted RNase H-like HicB family nuclease